MTRQEAIHLIEWLQKTPTAKQFYGTMPEELLRYYEEQKPALHIHDVVGQSEQFKCDCGCTNHYKNEMYDSVKCADCGTVYARI